MCKLGKLYLLNLFGHVSVMHDHGLIIRCDHRLVKFGLGFNSSPNTIYLGGRHSTIAIQKNQMVSICFPFLSGTLGMININTQQKNMYNFIETSF